MQDALIGLAHQKPYDAIAVKEILARADVGRSTFYAHFQNKDELLDSGIHDLLRSMEGAAPASTVDRSLAFSRQVFDYIDEHRRAQGPAMTRQGRLVLHERLQDVLGHRLVDDVAAIGASGDSSAPSAALLARHIAATFVLILNWWIEEAPALTPAEVDARFRALVTPVLTAD